jgi:hypothetical protein
VKKLAQNRQKPPARGRGPGRPFPKGNRANPGGRPKSAEANELIRELFKAKGVDVVTELFALCKAKDRRLRLSAINAVLDRVLGRPAQGMEIKTTEMPVTEAQLVGELRKLLLERDPKLAQRLAEVVGDA